MKIVSKVTKVVFALLFISAGIKHFVTPQFFIDIVPQYLPWPAALVFVSGLAEVVFGVALLIPPVGRIAAWGLVALLVAVFPANIHMAMHPELYPEIPFFALALRLPLQGVLIWWAHSYTRPVLTK